jgi:hypothetical protein
LDSFAVNEQDTGNVYLQGSGDVVVRFYAWADAAQMPLRRVTVDFNETGYVPVPMESRAISNFKPMCLQEGTEAANYHCKFDMNIPCTDANDCLKIKGHEADTPRDACLRTSEGDLRAGFGSTMATAPAIGTGCKEGMMEFQNTYSCDPTEVYKLKSLGENWKLRTDLCYNPGPIGNDVIGGSKGHFAEVSNSGGDCTIAVDPKYQIAPGTIVCAYRPSVSVMDNWGWCTGKCAQSITGFKPNVTTTSVQEDGCYDDAHPFTNAPEMSLGQCGDSDPVYKQNPYIPFKGNIIVIPAARE